MRRAPWAAGLLFGLSLAVLVTLVGPLLLFNPWFTSALQQRHGVAAAFETSQAEIDRATGEILVDLYLDGPFDAELGEGTPLLSERERLHMHDVAVLVRILAAAVILAAVIGGVSATWLGVEPKRQGRIMVLVGGGIGLAALLLAATFAIAFEPAFLAFHALFFPPGTYLFEPGSDLITLFPEGFWFDAALIAGASIVLTAMAVAVVGLRRWQGPTTLPRP